MGRLELSHKFKTNLGLFYPLYTAAAPSLTISLFGGLQLRECACQHCQANMYVDLEIASKISGLTPKGDGCGGSLEIRVVVKGAVNTEPHP